MNVDLKGISTLSLFNKRQSKCNTLKRNKNKHDKICSET